MGAMGQLEAFDPDTMAGTYNTPTTPTMENLTASGTTAGSGLPSYVTNFLQQGGTGTLAPPQYTMDPGAGISQAGTAVVPKTVAAKAVAKKVSGATAPKNVAPAPTAPGATGAKTDPMAGLQLIPMNAAGGYNSPGLAGNQPQTVSDMYNGSGSSQQVAWNKGGSAAPQLMSGGIYTDNKGGYFAKDPSGKIVPIPAGQGPGQADYVKKFFQGFGYA
jgi:hypothetical protein